MQSLVLLLTKINMKPSFDMQCCNVIYVYGHTFVRLLKSGTESDQLMNPWEISPYIYSNLVNLIVLQTEWTFFILHKNAIHVLRAKRAYREPSVNL